MPKAAVIKGRPGASAATTKARRRRASPSPSDAADRDPKRSLDLNKSLVLDIILAKLDSSNTFDWFTLAQKLGSQDTTAADNVATRVSPAGGPGSKAKKRTSAMNGNLKESKTQPGGGWTGAQLHDLYHNVSREARPDSAELFGGHTVAFADAQQIILPALKEGRPLWTESADGWSPPSAITPPTPMTDHPTSKAGSCRRRKSTSSPEPATPVTPAAPATDEVIVTGDLGDFSDISDDHTASAEEKGSASSSKGSRASRTTPKRYTRKAAIKYSYSSDSGTSSAED